MYLYYIMHCTLMLNKIHTHKYILWGPSINVNTFTSV